MKKLFIFSFLILVLFTLIGCNKEIKEKTTKTDNSKVNTTTQADKAEKENKMAAEFIIKDIKIGTGREAKNGDTVEVHYKGWLEDGKVFDTSKGREPFSFTLGQGMVIEGWEKGVIGMKEGGIRELTIPASMGYGSRGAGGTIPPNSTLYFEVELLKVK